MVSGCRETFRNKLCVLVNVHVEIHELCSNTQISKRACVDNSQNIKLESLILAQNERWRQA